MQLDLKFVGPSNEFMNGYPQADLQASDDEAAMLVASGLYDLDTN